MTQAMDVPTDDFQRDFDICERKIIALIFEKAAKGSKDSQFALDRMEKFFP